MKDSSCLIEWANTEDVEFEIRLEALVELPKTKVFHRKEKTKPKAWRWESTGCAYKGRLWSHYEDLECHAKESVFNCRH